MIVLNSLSNIYNINQALEVQQIILAQICVHEFCLLKQPSSNKQCLLICIDPIYICRSVSQTWGRYSFLSDKVHQYNVLFEDVGSRYWHLWDDERDTLQIPDLLLCP